jgi:hypothetical protein
MYCYAGLAKRLVKTCFPYLIPHQVIPHPVIPVTQLEPLHACNIIKPKEVYFVELEQLFKPISDEEAWAATVAWAEARAQKLEPTIYSAQHTNFYISNGNQHFFSDI